MSRRSQQRAAASGQAGSGASTEPEAPLADSAEGETDETESVDGDEPSAPPVSSAEPEAPISNESAESTEAEANPPPPATSDAVSALQAEAHRRHYQLGWAREDVDAWYAGELANVIGAPPSPEEVPRRPSFTRCRVVECIHGWGLRLDGHSSTNWQPGDVGDFRAAVVESVGGCLVEI